MTTQGETRNYLLILLLVVAIFATYSNSLYNSFHFDDNHSIVNNPYIRYPANIPYFFTSPNMFSVDRGARMYRPILLLTYAINYQIGGYNVLGYHIVNILLHILNSILIYIILLTPIGVSWIESKYLQYSISNHQISIDRRWIALSGAFLFGLHAINTQPVNYISSRSVLLVTFFYLLAFYLYVKSGVSPQGSGVRGKQDGVNTNRAYLFSLVSYAFALLSKEIAITLPLILILCDLLFGSRQEAKGQRDRIFDFGYRISDFKSSILRHLPFWAISAIYLFIRKALFHRAVIEVSYRTIFEGKGMVRSIYVNLLTQIKALVFYISKLFYPAGLSVDHYFPVNGSMADPYLLLSIIVVLSFLVIGITCIKKYPVISFGIFWFFIASLPETILPLNMVINEHRAYLPGVGFVFAITGVMSLIVNYQLTIDRVEGHRLLNLVSRASILLFIIYIPFNAFATYNRNRIWSDDLTLWTDAVEKNPKSFRAYLELGKYYRGKKMYKEALEFTKQSIRLSPAYHSSHQLLGLIYADMRDYNGAVEELKKAIRLKPSAPNAYVDLAFIYLDIGKDNEALDLFKKVVKINPLDDKAYYNMGVIYLKKGDMVRAEEAFLKVIELNPLNPSAYYNLGGTYMVQNRLKDALRAFKKALRLNPSDPDINLNIGIVYEKMGNNKEAEGYYRRALELKPAWKDAMDRLKAVSSPDSGQEVK